MRQTWAPAETPGGVAPWLLQIDPDSDPAHPEGERTLAEGGGTRANAPPVSLAARKGVAVFFAGELAGRSGLLPASSGQQAALSDAALLLDAYQRWGEGLLQRIWGPFALIIWDRQQNQITCARDHLGIQPLFWARAGSRWLFSDSAPALARHPEVTSRVNRAALADYLCHRWLSCEETFFSDVFRLPPGHLLRVKADQVGTERYWDPMPPDQAFSWLSEEDVGVFENLLVQAVRRCHGRGRAGIFLSGGMDSVTVAAVAAGTAEQEGRPAPLAASLGFPHPDCNEETVQRRVAEQLGIPQILLPFHDAVGSQGLLRATMDMADSWPAPLQNVWNPAYFRLALQAKAEGCDTILTGSGGDEWLGVDPIVAADLIRQGNLPALLRLLGVYRRSFRLPIFPLARNLLWNNGLRPVMRETWRTSGLRHASHTFAQRAFPRAYEARCRRERRLALSAMPDWVAPDPALRRELDERTAQRLERSQQAQGTFYFRAARNFLDHPQTTLDFEEAYENGRRLGMRIRHPFWDAELVQMLYRMPPEVLQRGGRSKGLVREMLARRFPGLGFDKQKKVVSLAFFRGLMLEEGANLWKQVGGTPALGELGIVDARKTDAMISRILAGGKGAESYRIWDFLSAENWTRPRV